jgi:hypothetical protein
MVTGTVYYIIKPKERPRPNQRAVEPNKKGYKLGSSPGRHCAKPATNRLSYGTAKVKAKVCGNGEDRICKLHSM